MILSFTKEESFYNSNGAKGIKTLVSGRLGGADIARYFFIQLVQS
jgi:ribosomal protein S3